MVKLKIKKFAPYLVNENQKHPKWKLYQNQELK